MIEFNWKTTVAALVIGGVAGALLFQKPPLPAKIETVEVIKEKIVVQIKEVEKQVKVVETVKGPVRTVIKEIRVDGSKVETEITEAEVVTKEDTKTEKATETKSESIKTVEKTVVVESKDSKIVNITALYPFSLNPSFTQPELVAGVGFRTFGSLYLGPQISYDIASRKTKIGLQISLGL